MIRVQPGLQDRIGCRTPTRQHDPRVIRSPPSTFADDPRFAEARAIADAALAQVAACDGDKGALRAAADRLNDAIAAVPRDFSRMADFETCFVVARLLSQRAGLLFSAGAEREAWITNRTAIAWAFDSGTETVSPLMEHLKARIFRQLAVCAGLHYRQVDGALAEARTACGSGLMLAQAGCAMWGDPPFFVAERAALEAMEATLGGRCPVWIGDVGGDWPFEDLPPEDAPAP